MAPRNITPAEERCTLAADDLAAISNDLHKLARSLKSQSNPLWREFVKIVARVDNTQELLENGY